MAMPPPAQDGQGAAAGGDQGGGGGGDIASFLTQTDGALLKIATAIQKSPQAPDEAKQAFAAALSAFRQGLEVLTGGEGGEGAPPAAGTTTPEQGGNPGAVPVSQGRPA
jgi:hypothetical protein